MPLDFNKIHKLATPTFVNGKWFKPQMSKMELRQVKKLALIAGVKWVDPPSMQKTPKPIEFVKMKGIQHDRRLEQRIVKSKELAAGQLRQWADIHKARRDAKAKERNKDKYVDFHNFFNPVITEPPIPKTDTIAWEAYYDKIARKEAKTRYWATLLKGSAAPSKKLSGEERLAKKRAEREAKKKEKADKAASKQSPKSEGEESKTEAKAESNEAKTEKETETKEEKLLKKQAKELNENSKRIEERTNDGDKPQS